MILCAKCGRCGLGNNYGNEHLMCRCLAFAYSVADGEWVLEPQMNPQLVTKGDGRVVLRFWYGGGDKDFDDMALSTTEASDRMGVILDGWSVEKVMGS